MALVPPVSFGLSSYAVPRFEGDRGKSKGGKIAHHPPEVTANHRKNHRVGDVVEFSTGRFKLTLGGAKQGLHWVKTYDAPTARTYKIK